MGNQGHAGNGWRLAYEFIKGGRDRRRAGVPHLDQPPDLAARRRPAHRERPGAGVAGLGMRGSARPRCGPTSRRRRKSIHPVQLARLRRLRLRRPGRHGLPHHRRHLRDHGARLRRHRRADLHDRPGQGPIPRRHDHQDDLPSQGRPPGFTTYWYEGKLADGSDNMPATPEELTADGRRLPRTGNLIVGTKGKMLVEGDYWNSPRLIPESKMKEFGKPKRLAGAFARATTRSSSWPARARSPASSASRTSATPAR